MIRTAMVYCHVYTSIKKARISKTDAGFLLISIYTLYAKIKLFILFRAKADTYR